MKSNVESLAQTLMRHDRVNIGPSHNSHNTKDSRYVVVVCDSGVSYLLHHTWYCPLYVISSIIYHAMSRIDITSVGTLTDSKTSLSFKQVAMPSTRWKKHQQKHVLMFQYIILNQMTWLFCPTYDYADQTLSSCSYTSNHTHSLFFLNIIGRSVR